MPCRSSIRPVYLPQPHACEGVSRNPGISQYSARTERQAHQAGIGTRVGDSEPPFVLHRCWISLAAVHRPQHRGAAMHRVLSEHEGRGRGRGSRDPSTNSVSASHGNRSRLRTDSKIASSPASTCSGQEGGPCSAPPAHRMVQHLTRSLGLMSREIAPWRLPRVRRTIVRGRV